jgi:hypothetical protein
MAAVALALACPIASAQAATGLEPGVHIDPGSPAAKEYALPLNQARQTGAPSPSSQPGGEGTLFGAGIKPPGSGGPGATGTGPRGGHSPAARGGQAGGTTGGAGAPAGGATGTSDATLSVAALRAAREQGPTGDGSLLALLGGGVVVLVLGGFGGTVLRHNRRPASPS